jgi:hypothetical protein
MIPIILTLCLTADPTPGIPLAVEAGRADKGTVKSGPALRHTFSLRHGGSSGTIVIIGIETGCGCLQKSLSRQTLQPGEKAELTLDVNTLTQPVGPNVWQATVLYRLDTPGVPAAGTTIEKKSVAIAATIEREIDVSPPMIAFSTSGEASQIITVQDRRPHGSLRVTQVMASSKHLSATIRTDGTVLLTLLGTAPADGKTTSETLTLATSDRDYPAFRIPVTIIKRPAASLTVTPEQMAIRLATGETSKSGVVQLRDPGGKLISIASATCSHPGITIVFSSGNLPVATVKATVDASRAGMAGMADVAVTLSTPAGQTLTIPLSWSGKP